MAELPNLGKHCHVENCNQLDFLPFTCTFCKKVFCLDHRTTESHGCSANEDNIISSSALEKAKSGSLLDCSFKDCLEKELLPVICTYCNENFCLKHRHSQDHQCPKMPTVSEHMPLTNRLVTSILGCPKDKAKKTHGQGRKSASTAAMVQLMKLKQKAVGDNGIPMEERIYFQIHLPKCHKTRTGIFFFSKLWTVGRVTDAVSEREKLLNENNKATKNKLQLFNVNTRKALPTGSAIEALVQKGELISGDILLLEYVHRDCLVLSSDYEL